MLCELIALASLVAHGDLVGTKTKELREQWRAGKIMDRLEKLHPNFFPRGVTQRLVGPREHTFTQRSKTETASKADLTKLYAICGNRLHRGTIANLDSISVQSLTESFDEIIEWTNRLKSLLAIHVVSLLDGSKQYICMLNTVPGGHVSLSLGVKQKRNDSA